MIDTTEEQARFENRIFCFVAVHSPVRRDDQFAIGMAVLGEPGYSFPLALELFPTYDEASSRTQELNRIFPYSDDTCVAIVADTMIRQSQRRPTIDPLSDLLFEARNDGTLGRLAGDVGDPQTIDNFCDAVLMLR